ncbi:hypothetical protein RAB80_008978 [Fusarium oxysporum f. sp. vasinfectum]|nr:hypothetical protein RAB80_008978 [Fusarium oxysporum f. sp. vasinfectum]KAK2933477.1 hypothetical protein FoTM2_007938 [Fusarium oxysporum f. sp. vasinfectum]
MDFHNIVDIIAKETNDLESMLRTALAGNGGLLMAANLLPIAARGGLINNNAGKIKDWSTST